MAEYEKGLRFAPPAHRLGVVGRPLHNPPWLWYGRFMQKPFRMQPALFVPAAELDRPALRALDDAESLPGRSEIERLLSSSYASRTGRPSYTNPSS